jgi:serine/threonine protein kinase
MPPQSHANNDKLIGTTIKDRYRIVSWLGAGGMGTAYRAWDEQAGVPVVIKIPKKVFLEDPKFAERFYREIRLLQGFNHPHIVPIEGVGAHEGGLPYVVLRFLPGGSLSNRRLRDDNGSPKPNPAGMLHLWLPAIADALDYVHAQGVVHRDVKPANIFFDAFWGAFLGDFGIAKIVEESETFDKEHTLTATHMGIGTPEYMAPEQFTPKAALDGSADQYALAVMAYEMVAGTRPFTGATAHLIVEVTTQQAPPLQAARYDLPSSLVHAVHRGLAKRPQERFASCREFAAAVLRDVAPIEDEPDVARLLCPKCSNILKLSTEAAGRRGKCPKCRTNMEVANDLGALWLLNEARRQRNATLAAATADIEPDQAVAVEVTEDEALEAFNPVSSTTPIERASRSKSPLRRAGTPRRTEMQRALWSLAAVVAGLVVAYVVIGILFPTKNYSYWLKKAKEVVKSQPEAPTANEFLGKHWCFRNNNWSHGRKFLMNSGVLALKSLAGREEKAEKFGMTIPTALELADAWDRLATNYEGEHEGRKVSDKGMDVAIRKYFPTQYTKDGKDARDAIRRHADDLRQRFRPRLR